MGSLFYVIGNFYHIKCSARIALRSIGKIRYWNEERVNSNIYLSLYLYFYLYLIDTSFDCKLLQLLQKANCTNRQKSNKKLYETVQNYSKVIHIAKNDFIKKSKLYTKLFTLSTENVTNFAVYIVEKANGSFVHMQ